MNHTEVKMKTQKIKSFYNECIRVFRITKKPTKSEYIAISKITGLGIMVIGLIGFIIHFIDQMVNL